jgi:hypothetical protein
VWGFFRARGNFALGALLTACALVVFCGPAQAQQSSTDNDAISTGDSQTSVHGYAQPTVQGTDNQTIQERTTEGVSGDQGAKFEGISQRPGGGYNDTPTAVQESVKGRARPEYEPNGVQLNDFVNGLGRLTIGRDRALLDKSNAFLGSFVLNTTMEAQTGFDSNPYRTQTNTKPDTVFLFRPGFTIGSDWNNDSVLLDVGAAIGRYGKNTTLDYQDYHVGISGRLDMFADQALLSGLRFDHLHSQPGTPDSPSSSIPTLYDTYAYNLGYRNEGGREFVLSDFRAVYYDYLHNGGVENDSLDRTELTLTTRVGYETTPGTKLFIEPSVNTRRYVRGSFNGLPDTSSQGGQLLGGFSWDYSGVTFLEFGAGYLRQTYDDPTLSTIQGPTANAKATWNATGLLTFTAGYARSVQETAIVGEYGDLETVYSLTADWEALYNLIVDAGVTRTSDDFRGASRLDNLDSFTLGLRYLMNQNWYFETRLFYDSRISNVVGGGYEDQRLLFTVGERL